jgi:hypothetical protein
MANQALYVSPVAADATVLAETATPLTSIPGNPNFPGPIMTELIADMQIKRDNFIAGRADSVYGGRAAKAIAKTLKKLLVLATNLVVDEVNRLAQADRDKLLTSGLRVGAAENERKVTEPLKVFKVYNGVNLGDIIIQAIGGNGTQYVVFQYAIAATEAEITQWTDCRRRGVKTSLTGLPSGSRIWVRAISMGPRGQEILSGTITTLIL